MEEEKVHNYKGDGRAMPGENRRRKKEKRLKKCRRMRARGRKKGCGNGRRKDKREKD